MKKKKSQSHLETATWAVFYVTHFYAFKRCLLSTWFSVFHAQWGTKKKVKKASHLLFIIFLGWLVFIEHIKEGIFILFCEHFFAFLLLHIKEALCGKGRNEEVKSCKKTQKENEKNFCVSKDRSVCMYKILQ